MPYENRRINPNKNDMRQREDYIDLTDIKNKIPLALDKENDPDGSIFFYCAEEIGKYLHKTVTVSQLRKIYHSAQQINIKFMQNADSKQNSIESIYQLRMLKAIIAYTAGRFYNNKNLSNFKDMMSIAIDETVKDEKSFRERKFKRFMDFLEAIIAYHRAYGGKE